MATEPRAEPGASARALRRFRVAFGLLLAVAAVRYFAHGWIDLQFHEPRFFFTWPGFGWVRPLPRPWMHVWFGLVVLAGIALAADVRPRGSALFLGVTWLYLLLIDKANYLNHYYLIALLCLLLAVRPRTRAGELPAWYGRLLRFQVGCVYFFAGIAKLQGDWLGEGEPLRIWLAHTDGWPWASRGLAIAGSRAAALFDLGLPFLLLARRTRRAAVAAAVVFHAATAVLFPVGLFPWVMIACTTVFWIEGDERRAWPRPAAARALLAGYIAVQILVPLRHWVRDGAVLWHERGFRFSWMVMLVEKQGLARFRVEPAGGGPEVAVEPAAWLTPFQEKMMATQPDMLRQFARHLATTTRPPGAPRPAVRADVFVALNGRPSVRFVDPAADLADRPGRGWILPSPRGSGGERPYAGRSSHDGNGTPDATPRHPFAVGRAAGGPRALRHPPVGPRGDGRSGRRDAGVHGPSRRDPDPGQQPEARHGRGGAADPGRRLPLRDEGGEGARRGRRRRRGWRSQLLRAFLRR